MKGNGTRVIEENGKRETYMGNKIYCGLTLDPEVVRGIDSMRQREKRSTYVIHVFREMLGLENNGVEA